MAKYEYCSQVFETHEQSGLKESLAKMGQQGWELVSITPVEYVPRYAENGSPNPSSWAVQRVEVYLKRSSKW